MNHAEKCPVCEGKGTVVKMDEDGGIGHTDLSCHGCNGKGWITVEDQGQYIPPSWPQPYYPSWPQPDPHTPSWYYQPATWTSGTYTTGDLT